MNKKIEENRFGKFIAEKRKGSNLTLRELCRKLSVTPSFLSKVESGERPAPSGELQSAIADVLGLTESERNELFDLAAETKRDGTLPYDISRYVCDDDELKAFLRKALKNGVKGSDLLKLI